MKTIKGLAKRYPLNHRSYAAFMAIWGRCIGPKIDGLYWPTDRDMARSILHEISGAITKPNARQEIKKVTGLDCEFDFSRLQRWELRNLSAWIWTFFKIIQTRTKGIRYTKGVSK